MLLGAHPNWHRCQKIWLMTFQVWLVLRNSILRSKTMKHCATVFKKRFTQCILEEESWEMRLWKFCYASLQHSCVMQSFQLRSEADCNHSMMMQHLSSSNVACLQFLWRHFIVNKKRISRVNLIVTKLMGGRSDWSFCQVRNWW